MMLKKQDNVAYCEVLCLVEQIWDLFNVKLPKITKTLKWHGS